MHKYHKFLNGFIILALLTALAWSFGPTTGTAQAKTQALLLQMAAQAPEKTISVIVQKASSTQQAEALAVKLGGRITKDLSMINAFAAEMTAGAARQMASSPPVRWISLDAPVQSSAAVSKFTAWATRNGTAVTNEFTSYANMLGAAGRDGKYGYGSQVKGAFTGFQPEYAPGQMIAKVEVTLRLYVPTALARTETPKLTPYVAGEAGAEVIVPVTDLNGCLGAQNACTRKYDITATRSSWTWANLNSLQIVIDQSTFDSGRVYYDAVGVRVTTIAGSDPSTPLVMPSLDGTAAVNSLVLSNAFPRVTRAVEIWNEAPYWQGSGVTVAVVDSGSFKTNAVGGRFIGEVNFNSAEHSANDQYGHGTFVTGLIADDGSYSGGKYMGIAPKVNILGVRVSDDQGMATESDVVSALQWIYNNHTAYNIRVVNLSLNSSMYQSYHISPLCAAVEILWFNRLVVVASVGNSGTAALYPPANDPFIITVGATDDKNTVDMGDDVIASFSAFGMDETGKTKPDLVAPGANLIAYLPDTNLLTISVQHPANRVDSNYFRMSGTSMSAPLVSGAAAILLQSNGSLAPDQVKYRLKATANKNWPGYNASMAGAGTLDVYAAVHGASTESANTNLTASLMLWTGINPITWGSVAWNSVAWNSVAWNSVAWNSVAWNSVAWNSDYWGP